MKKYYYCMTGSTTDPDSNGWIKSGNRSCELILGGFFASIYEVDYDYNSNLSNEKIFMKEAKKLAVERFYKMIDDQIADHDKEIKRLVEMKSKAAKAK